MADIKKINGMNIKDEVARNSITNLEETINELNEKIENVDFSGNEVITNEQYFGYKFINVKDEGAIGDGVTNDLPVLKQIFTNIENYSIIYFPSGTYLLGDGGDAEILLRIEDKENVKIIGCAKENTKIIAHPQTPIRPRMGLIHLHRSNYCNIENLELDGNSQLRHKAYGGGNWGDLQTTTDDCSNIQVDGANYTTIKNVYTHHPVMDCIITGRHQGGTTPNNHHLLIEDCILDYGYRQGLSIVGTNYGVLRNCRVTNTATALDLYKNDGTSKIGTLPKAGIDSETWAYNHNWLFENCYFEGNDNGHINLNDGASEHTITKCTFVGKVALISETPSAGARTINNIISNNYFLNSQIRIVHGGVSMLDNVMYFDDPTFTSGYLVNINNNASSKNGNSLISGNKISVNLDAYSGNGVDLSTLKLQVAFGQYTTIINNTFNNLIHPQTLMGLTYSKDIIVANNSFNCSIDMTPYVNDVRTTCADGIILSNNVIDSKYPASLRQAMNHTINTSSYSKDGSVYYKNFTYETYYGRKYYFPIIKKTDFEAMHMKVILKTKCYSKAETFNHTPTELVYKIRAHKTLNGQLSQKAKVENVWDSEVVLVTCAGLVEKDDGIIYLSIMNEFSSSYYMVNIEVECVDINGVVLNTLNFNASSYETIESLYPSGVQAKEYVVGDRVRSHTTTGGAYIYEVTKGGTTSSAKNLIEKTDYTVDGVVFKYVGVYPSQNTYGKQ